jgi:tellurite resistance protein
MLTEEKKSILRLLIALAWADGHVDSEEMEIVKALIDAFNASPDESAEIIEWAAQKRTLDEVDISTLTRSDLTLTLQYGVLLANIDGGFSQSEADVIDDLIVKLGLSAEEAKPLLDSALAFSQSLLPELES